MRHLLWLLRLAPTLLAAQILHWSLWRRRHQTLARFFHYLRRGVLLYHHLQL